MTPEESLAGEYVLFVQRSANRDGSAISGLMTVAALIEAGAEVKVCFGHEGAVIKDYTSAGCECFVLPHGDWLRKGGIVRSIRRIARERRIGFELANRLSGAKPSLIYVNSLVSLSGAVAARKLSIPCVWHVREMFADVGGEIHPPAFGGKGLVRRVLSQFSEEIVVNSKSVSEHVLGVRKSKLGTLIPNAVKWSNKDLDRTDSYRKKLGIAGDATVIAVIGSARPAKGQLFFLKTLRRVVNHHQNISVLLVGDFATPYGRTVIEEIDRLGLRPNVHLLGELESVNSVYSSCDIVCIPSRSESFGRIAVEAFFAGRPVIASSVGGLREIVKHEQNGLLFEYGNEQELATCLIRLIGDRNLAELFTRRARPEAESRFGEKRYRRNIQSICAKALSRLHNQVENSSGSKYLF